MSWGGRARYDSQASAVLVTHDQGEALPLADHVAVMRAGRLVQVDVPDTVYRRPADAGVASFVGGAVLLPGTVTGSRVRCALGDLEALADSLDGDVQVLVQPEQGLRGQTRAGGWCSRREGGPASRWR